MVDTFFFNYRNYTLWIQKNDTCMVLTERTAHFCMKVGGKSVKSKE